MRINRKIVLISLTILWMLVIFTMSSFGDYESEEMSLSVGRVISVVVSPAFRAMDTQSQVVFIESIDFFVRKAAHATEYAILAILYSLTLREYKVAYFFRYALLMAMLYACTDEIHQLFVPGRAGQFTDVMIDTSGAVVGCLILHTFMSLRKRLSLRKKVNLYIHK